MKILKTQAVVNGEGNAKISKIDTIEFQGKKWLVYDWIESLAEGWKTPLRIICLDLLPHEKLPDHHSCSFLLTYPIDKSVFDGQPPTGTEFQFLIVESPDIKIPTRKGLH